MIQPPTAPAKPPIPTTEATSFLGKISDASVNRFADHPWWADVATEMSARATHGLFENTATIPAGIKKAQTAIAVFLEAFSDQPRLMSDPESHPPATLPTSAVRKGMWPYFTIMAIERPRAWVRYLGSQKR